VKESRVMALTMYGERTSWKCWTFVCVKEGSGVRVHSSFHGKGGLDVPLLHPTRHIVKRKPSEKTEQNGSGNSPNYDHRKQ